MTGETTIESQSDALEGGLDNFAEDSECSNDQSPENARSVAMSDADFNLD